jgi:hypothetical protein
MPHLELLSLSLPPLGLAERLTAQGGGAGSVPACSPLTHRAACKTACVMSPQWDSARERLIAQGSGTPAGGVGVGSRMSRAPILVAGVHRRSEAPGCALLRSVRAGGSDGGSDSLLT